MIEMDGYLEIDDILIIERLGLEDGGVCQQFVDSQVITESDPYVPFQTGALKDSAVMNTVIGSGKVVYKTPYARRMYYNPEYNFNGAPTRGAYWFNRAMQNGGLKNIMDGLKKLIRKRK